MDTVEIVRPRNRSTTLILSHKCNLNCSYCYQKHDRRDNATMPLELAKNLLKREFGRMEPDCSLGIVLMGGEPFVDWPLLKRLCEWIFSQQWPCDYRVIVSTNGTLLTEEIKSWLSIHRKKITLGLSYDGTPVMQEANRKTSRFNVDLDFFLENWGRRGVKMTLSPETIGNLFDGLRYLHEECKMGCGYQPDTSTEENAIACNIAYGVNLGPKEYWALKGQLEKCVEWYLNGGQDYTPASILNFDFSYCPPEVNPENVHKYCGVGTAMNCYDVDGTEYPCQFFLPLTQSVESLKKLDSFDFFGNVSDPACHKCPIETLCPTCYGNNHLRNGNPFVRDKSMCPFFRLIFLANCVLQTRRLLQTEQKTKREIYTLRVIGKIYPRLLKDVKQYEAEIRLKA